MLNFKIKKDNFLKSLSLVQGATERKGILPVLSNLLIETINNQKNGFIKISATDLEISITTYCNVNIIQDGKITINARKLYSIIKEFPESKMDEDEYIDVKETEAGLGVVSYKKIIFKLTTIPVIDYPALIEIEAKDNFNIDLKTLRLLINSVIFSSAVSEDAKRNLAGVFFVLAGDDENSFLRLVATDGHRLSLAESEITYTITSKKPESADKDKDIYDLLKAGVIIPRKILNELVKIEENGNVNISINANSIIFKLDGDVNNYNGYKTEFTSRLIEGKFPDYQSVLPKDNYKILKVKTKDLSDSIRRVSLLAEEKSHSIELNFNNNALVIKTVHTNLGEASDEIEAKYTGEPLNIKLNSRYIQDFISNIPEEQLEIKFNTVYTPLVIIPVNKGLHEQKKINLIGVFMPMRY